MSINIPNATEAYSAQTTYNNSKAKNETATAETPKDNTGFSDVAAVYEPSSSETGDKVTATSTDRSAIVEMLKADNQARIDSMKSMAMQMITGQGNALASSDDIWSFLASGNFTVSEAAKEQAKQAISEDGYWGVKQTSDRILEFAKALSGNDPSKADELLDAFRKGYKQATKAWGKELPDISSQTYKAVEEKFEAWKKEAQSTPASSDTDPATSQTASTSSI